MGLIKGSKTTKDVAVIDKENRALSVSPTPEMLIQQAIDQKVSIEHMEKLMAMRRELKEEEAKKAYYRDLAAFQAECPVIGKNKSVTDKAEKGGALRYTYATLDEIVFQVAPFLQKHGFSYTFKNKQTDTAYTAICNTMHRDGHSESTEFVVPVDLKAYMSAPQKVGSARSFANRYAFCNAFGVQTGEDNNANSVGEAPPVEEEKKEVVKSALYKAAEKQIFKDVKNRKFKGKIMVDGSKVDLIGVKAQLSEMLRIKVYSEKKITDIKERVARYLMIAEGGEPEATASPPQAKETVIEKPEVVDEKPKVEPPAKSEEYLEIEAQMIRDITHKAFMGEVYFEVKKGEPKEKIDLVKYRRGLPDKLAKSILPMEDLIKKADIVALLLQAALDKDFPQDTPGKEKFIPPEGHTITAGPGAVSLEGPDGEVDPATEPGEESGGSLFEELADDAVEIEREGKLTEGG